MGIIKKRLEDSKALWPKELLSILWAYCTMVRTPIRETSFLLAFRIEAVILVEIRTAMHRTTNFNPGKN